MTFGKNRVQYTEEKIWSYFRFSKYDTYFYQNGRELAINTALYTNQVLTNIENSFQYPIENKIQFIIFNSLSDLKQSNIGLTRDEIYNIGGVTQVIGNTVVLYFDGNYRNFERQIRIGIAKILVNQIFYGDQLASNIKNSAFLFLAEWYINGLVSYIADDWSTEFDNKARNGFINGAFQKFNHLTAEEAIIAGHSIWKFVDDRYGKDVIPNIVYMTKISRSIENGFMYVLGMTFKEVIKEWEKYYIDIYHSDVQNRDMSPVDSQVSTKKNKSKVHFHSFAHNPQKNLVAYATDNLNKKEIWLQDFSSPKRKRIFKMGHKVDELSDYSYPLIAWHPSGELLAFLVEQKGFIKLYYYILETKAIEKQSVFGVDKIHSMAYSPDGTSLLVSATMNGQSDIFLYHLQSKTFEQITKDIFDDQNPSFVYDGKYIAFSSNRISDTLTMSRETFIRDYSKNIEKSKYFSVFLYNYHTKSPILWRITDESMYDAIYPTTFTNNSIQFLSNKNGIFNRYVGVLDSTISHVDTVIHYKYFTTISPITDYVADIEEHYTNVSGDKISEILYQNNEYSLFTYSTIKNTFKNSLMPTTFRKHTNSFITTESKISVDSVFEENKKQVYPIQPLDSGKIDINNFIFETITQEKTDSIVKNSDIEKSPKEDRFTLPQQRNYDVEYSINQLINQLDYNYINYSYQLFTGGGPIFFGNGLNAFLKVGVNDLLENYRLFGGVRLSFDLQNNEYLIGFENYKKRLNKQWLFHRQSNEISSNAFMKYRQHSVFYILTYPFNNVFAIKNSFSLRKDIVHFLSVDYQHLNEASRLSVLAGNKTELIFDNTRNPQTNIYFGTRGKLWVEYYQGILEKEDNLIVAGIDVRHYIPLHKNFIWANRFASSTSFGITKLIYYMGGVDNWLIPKFNEKINVPFDKNYTYQTIASNMRGFTQNIRNGNSFTLINSEFRFPLFRYFYNRPLRSQVLNNFQIVAFGDIGTAWEGWNPFSENNSLFTSTIEQKPITVIVKRQKNPIVGGFGPGLRTTLFGYFIRLDYAWGVEDGKIGKPIFYFSLSLDF